MTASDTTTCREYIDGRNGCAGKTCGKAVKGEFDGKPMCGIHLAAKRKRQASTERWQAEWAAKDRAKEISGVLAARLADLGVTSTASTDGDAPGVRLGQAAVEALIVRLNES